MLEFCIENPAKFKKDFKKEYDICCKNMNFDPINHRIIPVLCKAKLRKVETTLSYRECIDTLARKEFDEPNVCKKCFLELVKDFKLIYGGDKP